MKKAPKDFRAPYITQQKAWQEADSIRENFWGSDIVPVEVEEILWNFGIRIEPIPSLKQAGDIDALLSGDLKTIVVDAEEYMDDRKLNRIRFSIAHELGHFILHKEVYSEISFESVEEWIYFIQNVPEVEWSFVELHAYEFAGRLLVPPKLLKEELFGAVKQADRIGFMDWEKSGDAAREYISNKLARKFGVSSEVIEKRIIREGFWPPT